MAKPDFFIVGAPRCGTSSLYTYLKQHPDIYMPERKELRFFSSDLRQREGGFQHIRTVEEYLSYFDGAQGQKRIGEASPVYMISTTAAREIHEFNPEAKIIIMLRSPIDVMYSWWSHLRFLGHERLSFEGALAAEEERRLQPESDSAFAVESLLYRYRARFSERVERFFDAFGREQVYIIIFDDFEADTAKAYRDVLTFLEVAPDFQPEFERVNANQVARNALMRDFMQHPPALLMAAGQAIRPVAQPLYWKLSHLNTRYAPREPMNPELRKQLQAEFLPEVTRLSELLGRDLTHWCRD
jgi:hypothetical protein